MKILSMTATFGKLDGQTLTLEPGMNVIHAPNEWGKSTWCAFISAMLYGIETSQRTSSKGLADKERYAPWSGKPMSGRMDILWNGRHITLERSTKGRSIFGVFRAYETESGLDVPELTGENCGQMLLGVEKSVFLRAGFLKLTDLPVTDDQALRRRLNALVTTGDESGASDKLAQKLKDLKNNCRHNKTGLIPQAQLQQAQLQEQLNHLDDLQDRRARQKVRIQELEQQLTQLKNHQIALAYEAYQADGQRLTQAKAAEAAAREKVAALTAQCAALPSQEEAKETLEKLSRLQEQLNDLQNRPQPALPDPPKEKQPFRGLDEAQTREALEKDLWQYAAAKSLKPYIPGILIALAGAVLALVLCFLLPQFKSWCVPALLVCMIPLVVTFIGHSGDNKIRLGLESKYGTQNTALWQTAAEEHIQALQTHRQASEAYNAQREQFRQEQAQLQQQVMALTQGAPVTAAQKYWEQVQNSRWELAVAEKDLLQAQTYTQTLSSMVREVPAPTEPDTLTLSAAQTQQTLQEATAAHQQLQWSVGQLEGQMEPLGTREQLQNRLDTVNRRLQQLLQYEAALILAQQTLTTAANELQRQFAPRISKRAQELFSRLTDGRYDRLTISNDLSLSTGAQGEDNLHAAQWRSDGTVDQLYLSLRLAVAAELTPEAPLVLDDALVRFDDTRLASAMELLKAQSQDKQIILFTCQERESAHL